MKYSILFLSCLGLLLFSGCKKDDDPVAIDDNIEHECDYVHPNTIGSFWVYEWYEIRTDSPEEQLNRIDTITVIGDTLINGKEYKIYQGSYFGTNDIRTNYQRDSNGYIIDTSGHVIYSYVNFEDILRTDTTYMNLKFDLKMKSNQIESTPTGVHTTIEAIKTYSDRDGGHATNCGDSTFTNSIWYSSGIGKIKERTGYFVAFKNCSGRHLEARLIDYYIAP
jgi:hypothetical protein